ncbi:MAG: cupin domain-containing protein [Acidovorax sp.]
MSVKITQKKFPIVVYEEIIHELIPAQGKILIQSDQPAKEHDWHQHETDETLVVLQGAMDFYYDNQRMRCMAGDMIQLGVGTRHKSIASPQGAIYLIALHI